MNEDTSCYNPPRAIIDMFNEQDLTFDNNGSYGSWNDLKAHARVQIELIQHHYPKMTREAQLRAGKTIKNLSEQHGISI